LSWEKIPPTEIKNIIEGINSRIEQIEEIISKPKSKLFENIQLEEKEMIEEGFKKIL
jgi:hypothetical protein